jgi:hypothetical protein
MFRSKGKLASLDENHVPIIFACILSSSTPRLFYCLIRYPAACWCALNFPQQSRVNTYEGEYRGVRGRDGGGEQGVKGNEFHCRGRQEALVAKKVARRI